MERKREVRESWRHSRDAHTRPLTHSIVAVVILVVCVVVVILDARSAWSSLLVLLAGLLDGLLGVAWCCLMACLVLLGVAWCCLVVVLGCGWITGLMADRWLRAGGWVFVGGACSSCLLAGGCWLAWCCCCLLLACLVLLGLLLACLVLLGCGWITGADRCRRADRWLACGWLVVLVSQKFLLLLWASSVQACCV